MSMSMETLSQITPKSEATSMPLSSSSQGRRSLRAKAMSPTTVRKAMEDRSSNDLFSPTSAAAIALSSLHQFGAQRDNRAAPPDTELKGTRLFNNPNETPSAPPARPPPIVTQDENDNGSNQTNHIIKNNNNKENNQKTNQKDGNQVINPTKQQERVQPTFTPSYHHHNTPPPPPTAYPHHLAHQGQPQQQQQHHYHHDPTQQPQQYNHQHPHTWRRPVAPLPMHPNYVARYNPYTHAQMDPSFSAGWDQQQQQPPPQHPQPPPHTYSRTSPVSSLGPYGTAPMPRPPAVLHPPPQPIAGHPNKFARLASCASTLVTPTPKKAKLSHPSADEKTGNNSNNNSAANYSRKKKSLGILAENFLNTYKSLPKGSTIVVDEAAVKLGVERRRIYDVVNILESICLVCKKHKNTYTWMGMEHLDAVFGRLQAQAIAEYPQDAQKFLGSTNYVAKPEVPCKPARKQSKSRENKSLAKLSQEFLQVFLVGHETLSLPEASDKIQGTTSVEELIAMGSSQQKASTEKELKAAAARGLKTKIRRLYDIANVFLSVGLLKKVDRGDASRRPNFSWSYTLSAKQVYQMHNRPEEETTTIPEPMMTAEPPAPMTKTPESQPTMTAAEPLQEPPVPMTKTPESQPPMTAVQQPPMPTPETQPTMMTATEQPPAPMVSTAICVSLDPQ